MPKIIKGHHGKVTLKPLAKHQNVTAEEKQSANGRKLSS